MLPNMVHIFMHVAPLIVLAGLGVAMASCRERPAPTLEALTADERGTISETVRRLYRQSSETFDSDLDCEEIVTRLVTVKAGRHLLYGARRGS